VSRGACHIPSAWAEYRQALRTLPETITDSASIVWPVAPVQRIRHTREVNAVLDEGGACDKAATRARVEQVALGVAHKIALGVIAEPAPEPAGPAAV
jgi:hypothetical protein